MIVITLQREKCIGCNYCVEVAGYRWRMSKKDGKAVLLGSTDRRGFHTIRVNDTEFEDNKIAAERCPVKIISVKEI
jgi:ferredoxin